MAEHPTELLGLLQRGEVAKAAELAEAVAADCPTDPRTLELIGIVRHKSGDQEGAIAALQQARALADGDAAIAANLAIALMAAGRLAEAEAALRAALALRPGEPVMLANLSAILERRGAYAESHALLADAVARTARPDWIARIGRILYKSYNHAAAERTLLSVLHDLPDSAEPRTVLGLIYEVRGEDKAAARYHGAAFRRAPDDPRMMLNLAHVLSRIGRGSEAIDIMILFLNRRLAGGRGPLSGPSSEEIETILSRLAAELTPAPLLPVLDGLMALDPVNLDLMLRKAQTLHGLDRGKDALAAYQAVLDVDPRSLTALLGKAQMLQTMGRSADARESFRDVLRIAPDNAAAMGGLIYSYSLERRLDEANAWARRAMHEVKDRKVFFGASLMVFVGTCDYAMLEEVGNVLDEVERDTQAGPSASLLALLPFGESEEDTRRLMRITGAMGKRLSVQAPDDPGSIGSKTKGSDEILGGAVTAPLPRRHRPLRIGLLSGDLRNHSVGRFVRPLIEAHDRDRIRFYCYSSFPGERDETAHVIAARTELYERVTALGDAALVARMRDDRLDIAFDLSGITMYTRMTALATRAAPVQVEWLGYPFTTGLPTMDYFLVDRHLRPASDDLLFERPLVMDRSWITVGWLSKTEVAQDPPCLRNGYVTFGTLNNSYKYSRASIALWAQILHRVPNARFIVIRPEASSVILRANIVSEFKRHGIEAGRIEFFNNWLNDLRFDECYNHFDISLDTTPLTGGTTTVDCLDMGVPVVTLAGPAMHQRISHAILNGAGFGELSAANPEDYVETAVALARDLDRIAAYRHDMRARLRASPLCDGAAFAEDFATTMERVALRHTLIDRTPDLKADRIA